MGFGGRLRALRMTRGLTQTALANLVGVGNTYISDLERGHKGTPTGETVLRLAEALRCSTDYLLGMAYQQTAEIPGDVGSGLSSFSVGDPVTLSRPGGNLVNIVLVASGAMDTTQENLSQRTRHDFLIGIAQGAQEHGIHTNLVTVPDFEAYPEAQSPSRVFVFPAPWPEPVEHLTKKGLHCISLNPPCPYEGYNIMVNSEVGTYTAVQDLVSNGRKRVAFLRCPNEHMEFHAKRIRGFRRALSEGGIAYLPELAIETTGTAESGYIAMQHLLQLANPPDAVFAATDLRALGALDAIKEAGLRVPEDIAVVGFDDIPEAATTRPPLSTVRFPRIEAGLATMNLAAKLLADEKTAPNVISLEATYIRRASVN